MCVTHDHRSALLISLHRFVVWIAFPSKTLKRRPDVSRVSWSIVFYRLVRKPSASLAD
jgi:hypothetical protein